LILFVGPASRHIPASAQARCGGTPQLFFGVAGGTLAVIVIGSVSKTLEYLKVARRWPRSPAAGSFDPNTAILMKGSCSTSLRK